MAIVLTRPAIVHALIVSSDLQDQDLHTDGHANVTSLDAMRLRALQVAIVETGRPITFEVVIDNPEHQKERRGDGLALYYKGVDMGRFIFVRELAERFMVDYQIDDGAMLAGVAVLLEVGGHVLRHYAVGLVVPPADPPPYPVGFPAMPAAEIAMPTIKKRKP